MPNGFVPVLTRLEELANALADMDPKLEETSRFLKCRQKADFYRRFDEITKSARKYEITFILQEHEAPGEIRLRKAVKRSQEKVYQTVKTGGFDLVGIEGFETTPHLSHLLTTARGVTASLPLHTRRELHHSMKFCGAFRACSELPPGEVHAIGLEVAEAREFQAAVLNLIGRRLRAKHEALTLLQSVVGPSRSVFATLILVATAEKGGFKKPALVMGHGHEGEFLTLSLLWGFGARLINTTFD